jgi:serine/threonine protein kinase
MSLQPFDAGSVFGEGRYVVTSETLLGKGTQGNVYSAQHRESGASIAVKVIDRLDFEGDPRKTQQLQREMDIAYKLKHPNIVNLRDVVFEPPEPNHEYVMLISDLVDGGSLYEHVQHGAMPEPDAQYVFKQIISGVEYCHKQGVVHRDLKLENLLLTATPPQVVKIADFGVSKDTSVNSMPKTQVGTISYMAPEVTMINKRDSGVLDYGAAADVWSLGVILFVLVCGRYPFGFDGPKSQGGMPTFRVYERIRSGLVEFPPSLSPEILEMLQGMLTTDPLSRWTLERIRGCAWYQGGKFYVPPPVELELGTPSIRWPDPSPRAAAAAAAAADPFSSVRTAELNGGTAWALPIHTAGVEGRGEGGSLSISLSVMLAVD